MKKTLVGLTFGGVLPAILFPRYETLNQTSQFSLWTYPSNNRSFTFAKKPPQICGRFGGLRPSWELLHWDRMRFGFPFRAITIDCQRDNGNVQARGELIWIAINFGCGASIGFALFCVLLPRLVRRKKIPPQ